MEPLRNWCANGGSIDYSIYIYFNGELAIEIDL